MKIAHLSFGPDIGGQSVATKAAFARLAPEHEVRAIGSYNSLRYPEPEPLRTLVPAQAAYDWADVVVLHNFVDPYYQLDHGQRKPIVVHHHGSHFRNNAERLYAEGQAIGALQVVSTVDLLLSVPKGELEWLPQVIDVDAMAAIRNAWHRPDGRLRIVQAPTNWEKKGTREVIGAVAALARRYPVEMVLIDGSLRPPTPWLDCIAQKATCDVLVDQFELGYGNNAVEAWALGMPVVSGARPEIAARMRKEYHRRGLPFIEATVDTVEGVLEAVIRDPSLRAAYAKKGMEHVRRFHSQEAVVARLTELYARVPASVGARKAA